MSDTIDATAQPVINPPRVDNPPPLGNLALQVSAGDFVRLAQGFYFIFWGLLLTVLTAAQLLLLIGNHFLADSFLGAGVLAVLVGSWRLYQVRSLGEHWRNRTRMLLTLAALLNYFCICFWFWQRAPDSVYLLGNALAFVAIGIFYMIEFNRAIAALASALGHPEMALESRVLGAGNAVLLLLPFVCVIAYLIGMVTIRHGNPFVELQSLLDRVSLVIVLLLLLPFSLTLSLAWGCKDAVLRQIAAFDLKPPKDSDPT
jgi:hypothetical protein